MIIFNGIDFASQKEEALKQRVTDLRGEGVELKIAAVLFREDEGSVLYSSKKKEAAARVGIEYELYQFSMLDPVEEVVGLIEELNDDESLTGIIVQKPTRSSFIAAKSQSVRDSEKRETYNAQRTKSQESRIMNHEFDTWWGALTGAIAPEKDVDGLSPVTMAAIIDNTWEEKGMVLPATCGAVLEILQNVKVQTCLPAGKVPNVKSMSKSKVIILGKSDLLGRPLYYVLKNQGIDVELIGRKELESRIMNHEFLLDADVIVSSTGRPGLITGEMVSEGVVIIDAGEPQGDVDFASVKDKASFITPVPGGVGPVTVVELLGNCVELAR